MILIQNQVLKILLDDFIKKIWGESYGLSKLEIPWVHYRLALFLRHGKISPKKSSKRISVFYQGLHFQTVLRQTPRINKLML